MEIAELAMDVELLLVAGLYAAYDLCVDAEALADLDDALCLAMRSLLWRSRSMTGNMMWTDTNAPSLKVSAGTANW